MKKYFFFLALACCSFNGCVKMYTLPDPPPKEDWVDIASANEDPEVKAKRKIEAQKAAIQCYAALSTRNWTKALSYMSDRTKQLLKSVSEDGSPETVLASGKVVVDGENQAFDPVGDVFITGITDIRDEFGDHVDLENATRHVFYAVNASEQAREIVMILEDGKWVVDMAELFSPIIVINP